MEILSMHLHEKTLIFFVEMHFFDTRSCQCIQTKSRQLRKGFLDFGEQKLKDVASGFCSFWMFEDLSAVATESAQFEPRPFTKVALECNCI